MSGRCGRRGPWKIYEKDRRGASVDKEGREKGGGPFRAGACLGSSAGTWREKWTGETGLQRSGSER